MSGRPIKRTLRQGYPRGATPPKGPRTLDPLSAYGGVFHKKTCDSWELPNRRSDRQHTRDGFPPSSCTSRPALTSRAARRRRVASCSDLLHGCG